MEPTTYQLSHATSRGPRDNHHTSQWVPTSFTVINRGCGARPESSLRATLWNQPSNTKACEACGDPKQLSELARTPCGHAYCSGCMKQIFSNATENEASFPPSCCRQPIPIEGNEVLLSPEIISCFRTKTEEFTTPNRTYCHRPECASFIPSKSHANNIAMCSKCCRGTCLTCKGATHNGACPSDEQLQQLLRLAQDKHWQQCQNCKALVEITGGCNHITCRCKHQFCYRCGAKWMTCSCIDGEEDYAIARHVYQQRIAMEQEGRRMGFMIPREQRELVQAFDQDVAPELRPWEFNRPHILSGCNHDMWRFFENPQPCQNCGATNQIYHCAPCGRWLCVYCISLLPQ